MSAQVGLIGLAVMGQNLVLNMSDHGIQVAVYNRSPEVTQTFAAGPAADRSITPCYSLSELIGALERPRRVMIMVRAGRAVDEVLRALTALLDPEDIIVDLGNSQYQDSERRVRDVRESGIRYVGCGVSGGELGARHGPSIMPGGDADAWPHLAPILPVIAAQVDGEACCAWLGNGGAGHYVKMVHNGIEYGDMQLIAEVYHLMRDGLGMDQQEMARQFTAWNRGDLNSYLIEITADILNYRESDGTQLLDHILDTAGQKGTGKWTGISALELGQPVSLIGEAVFARCLSALKDERVRAAKVLKGARERLNVDRAEFLDDLGAALYAAKIASYAQGFMLLRSASQEFSWDLDFGAIAMLWRGGCIIRSQFLNHIRDAYADNPGLDNLLMAPFFAGTMGHNEGAWRRVVAAAVSTGIPVPALSAGLSFYDGYRSERLPANLLQAQRDYFGAHTYERLDRQRGEFFHTNWTGAGGDVSARTYNE
ncbi:MAG: decarboxylating NADP(+)-dependent phosphogluconate dehydrogenase [Pseudomonadota bacterium]